MNSKLFEAGRILSDISAYLKTMDMSKIDEGHKQLFLRKVNVFQEVCRRVGFDGKAKELAVCQYCGKTYQKKVKHQKYCHSRCRMGAWQKRENNAGLTEGKNENTQSKLL